MDLKFAVGGKPLKLVAGEKLTIVSRKDVFSCDQTNVVGTIYTDLAKDLRPGNRILLSDGLMEVRVESIDGDKISTSVVFGGLLKGSQGINVPDAVLSARSVSDKDLADLAFGLASGVDMVAVSFVKSAEDMNYVRKVLQDTSTHSQN